MGEVIRMRQNISRLPDWRSGLCTFVKTSRLKICCTPPRSQISQSGKCKKSVFNCIAVVGHLFLGIMSHFQICPWPCGGFVDFRIGHLWDISELYFPPQGHNKAVDWWALGILIYEMLAGEFHHKTVAFSVVHLSFCVYHGRRNKQARWRDVLINRKNCQVTHLSMTTTRLGSTRRSCPGNWSGRAMSRWRPRTLSSDCWSR